MQRNDIAKLLRAAEETMPSFTAIQEAGTVENFTNQAYNGYMLERQIGI